MDVVEFVKNSNELLVSPIWSGKQAFRFLCLGHLDVSEALGFELQKISPQLTIVKEGQMCTKEQLDKWINKHKVDATYLNHELDILQTLKKECCEEGTLYGGGCFGPLTVVSGIMGVENMLKALRREPDFVREFVECVTEYMEDLAKREAEKGIDFFWIAEPLASLLSPENFWEFSGRYIKRIYEASSESGFLHVCGKTLQHTKYMVKTGAKVLSIDSCTDIGKCIRMVSEDVIIMGNVSPSTLRFGTVGEVEKEIQDIFDSCHGFKNFVLSTGCSIMGGTPDENMRVMFDMAKKYK